MLHTIYIDKAISFINDNKSKGNEIILNDCIHFGVGDKVYMWRDAIIPELKPYMWTESKNSLFINLNKKGIYTMLKYYEDMEDYFLFNDGNDDEDTQEL